MAKVILSQW